MNRLLTINAHRFHRQSEKGTIHMNTQRIFKLFLLLATLALSSTVAQAQWGRKWDLTAASTVTREETPADDQPFDKNIQAASGGIFDTLDRQKTAIAGSWLLTVNAGGPPLKALASFTSDGIFLSTAQGDVNANAGAPTISPIHGAWAHNGGRQFITTHIELGYSVQTGELIGTLKLQQVINLNDSGDAWTATLRFTLFDPNGNALFSGTGTAQATRIKVEPPK